MRTTSTATCPTPGPASTSRRGVLLGAAAAGVVGLAAGAGAPAAAASLPTVTPLWSEALRRRYGVAVQPQLRSGVFGAVSVWPTYVAQMNAHFIRGRYSNLPGLRGATDTVLAQCRALGLKWVMTLVPEDWSMSPEQLRGILADIRDRAADVCIAVEGVNEPNHNKNGSALRPDWATATVAYQRIMSDFVRGTPALSHVAVLGPSLQMQVPDLLADFAALTAAGLPAVMTHAGLHSYPAGLKPDNQVDTRLGHVRTHWGPVPTWVSETGYTTAMGAVSVKQRPVPADVAATYAPRSLLEYARRGCNSTRYKLLDSPDPSNADVEASYGLVSCRSLDPATWTPKPEYTAMQAFLGSLRDTAAAYAPAPVPLQVTAPSSVQWVLTGRSDGTTTLLAYLNVSVWDFKNRVRVNPAPVDVVVTDRAGTRTVRVGPTVTSIPVR